MKRVIVFLALAAFLAASVFAAGTGEGAAGVEGKPVLKFLGGSIGVFGDPNEGPTKDALEAITGYSFEVTSLPTENSAQALNLQMASGEKYDLIRAVDYSQFLTFVANGAVLPITDLVDKHGPAIKSAIPAGVWEALKADDGNVYGFPSTASPTLGMAMVARTDWLGALGISAPTNLTEFRDALKKIKDADPGKIGARLIAYTGFDWWRFRHVAYQEPFMAAFGVPYEWVERDGGIVSRYETEEIKQYIAYMKDLYEEGLLDPDFAVLQKNVVDEKVTSGRVAFALYHWDWMYKTRDAWKADGKDWKIDFVKYPVGPNGESAATIAAGIGVSTFVPQFAENPEHAVKYVNEFIKPENYQRLIIGDENVHWKWEGESRIPILPIFNDERGNMFWYEPIRVGEVYYPLWKTRVNKIKGMGIAYSETEGVLMDVVQPDPIGLATQLNVTALNRSSLRQLAGDELLKFILGARDISEYDQFLRKWMAEGGAASKEEINAWYRSR